MFELNRTGKTSALYTEKREVREVKGVYKQGKQAMFTFDADNSLGNYLVMSVQP